MGPWSWLEPVAAVLAQIIMGEEIKPSQALGPFTHWVNILITICISFIKVSCLMALVYMSAQSQYLSQMLDNNFITSFVIIARPLQQLKEGASYGKAQQRALWTIDKENFYLKKKQSSEAHFRCNTMGWSLTVCFPITRVVVNSSALHWKYTWIRTMTFIIHEIWTSKIRFSWQW